MISTTEHTADLIVVGAGAAGLMAAIARARRAPEARVVCLDGARTLGAKILVSGGSRCNVTNRLVTEKDFWGGSPRFVRRVLQAYPAERSVAFFAELGASLHEEEDGKLFPDSNSARTVLTALLDEAKRRRVDVRASHRVVAVARADDAFVVGTANGASLRARHVVLATGGRSLPKSGSDGFGYALARGFGHRCVETTPALVPLQMESDWHATLSGVSHRGEIAVRIDGRVATRLTGTLLWTHFGASGPLMLDASRHWHRAIVENRHVALLLNSLPGDTFETLDAWLLARRDERPRAVLATVISERLPAAVAHAWIARAGCDPATPMSHLERDARRRLIRLLVEQPLPVTGSRGYNYAEVTAGGVALDEIDAATMQSRLVPGLYFAGEIVDVDGRLGGFNFQWAWSSGFVAGCAAASNGGGD